MIEFIDSHAHLSTPKFDGDRKAVLQRAVAAGVSAIVDVGSDIETSMAAASLAEAHPGRVYATAGVDPHVADRFSDSAAARIEQMLQNPRVVAVGETGLDYYYEHSQRDVQQRAFKVHIELALLHDLPMIVHCREAFDDCFRLLGPHSGELRGVAHCFTGNAKEAEAFLQLGFYVSFAGIITFSKAETLREAASAVPLERTLIETDCPYLAPEPYRGRRNEPAWVVRVAERLAELHGCGFEAVASATTANARKLFRLAEKPMGIGEG